MRTSSPGALGADGAREPRDQGAPGQQCAKPAPPASPHSYSTHALSCLAPRFGVASGGEREGDSQSGEKAEAARSNWGRELTIIDEGDEETKTCSPSEEPNEGEPCRAHGGPALCAATRTPPLPASRAGRCSLLTPRLMSRQRPSDSSTCRSPSRDRSARQPACPLCGTQPRPPPSSGRRRKGGAARRCWRPCRRVSRSRPRTSG